MPEPETPNPIPIPAPEDAGDSYKDKFTKIKPETIALVKDFIEVQRPWRGTDDEKKVKFNTLLNKLCAIYQLSVPRLVVDPTNQTLIEAHGMYNLVNDTISLPKYSVVTFLHEFKHMMQHKKNKQNTENIARGWSVSLFYRASPKHYRIAKRKGLLLFD
jgi:hypothetical protein